MSTIALNIDTHKAIKILTSKGVSEKQAEAIVEVIQEIKVPKEQIESRFVDFKSDMKEDFHSLDLKIEKLRTELLVKIPAIIAGIFGFIELIKKLV